MKRAPLIRTRLAWGLKNRFGRMVGSEAVFPATKAPADCLAMWPALAFRTREAAREFVRKAYAEGLEARRPRVVRVSASLETADEVDQ
jgi:hypothetical protein